MDFEEHYDNAAEIRKENIPTAVFDDLAAMFYAVFCRIENETPTKGRKEGLTNAENHYNTEDCA